MKLEYNDIIDKHKNTPCVVALHGPSLNNHKNQIEALQREKKILRISVNEWYDFFNEKPDYWVVSNGEFTIEASIHGSKLWSKRNYPHNVFNNYNIPLIYSCIADLTDFDFIDKHLTCDYLPFDTRHFKQHSCIQILKNFKNHYEKNKNLNFCFYGNNKQMWQKPNVKDYPDWFKKIHGRIGHGWSINSKCCKNKLDITLQEKLQQLSNHSRHMSPGYTVGLSAVCFALLMGCNPIYISGLDLDYTLGYAGSINDVDHFSWINMGNIGHWKDAYRDFLLDDMTILKESAELLDVKIINLNKNAWYNTFTKGELLT